MTKSRRIYLLSPKELNPETIAVSFAKTSRSPLSFDTIAAELNDDKSAQFHEKWVVGYGHASVAEHAVLHLALENVSRLAIETIENNRLASYTEKSTRYQQWDQDAFYVPEEINGHSDENDYIRTCQLLFRTYEKCIPGVMKWLQAKNPIKPGETEKVYHHRIHTAAVDICRFFLPASSLANVGMTINARALEYAICKMLSSPLHEVQAIGEKLRDVSQLEIPTLIKYAACNEYLVLLREKIRTYSKSLSYQPSETQTKLISWDQEGENKVLAAILLRFSDSVSFHTCLDHVNQLTDQQIETLVNDLMEKRGQFDQPLREFEYAQMTFDSVMDQGAYFEFKRHRMMTQTAQNLTSELGYAIPKGITESGSGEEYDKAMGEAARVFNKISDWNPEAASYIIPNGYNRRVVFTLNLRQAYNLIRLRAASNAHFSIQRVACQMAEEIKRIYPFLGRYLDLPSGSSWQKIEADHFSELQIIN
jgi:thymidylate synthase ThyX